MKALFTGILILTAPIGFYSHAQSPDSLRWKLATDGGIEWVVKADDSHIDHVEMSGFYLSSIVHYGVKHGKLEQTIQLVFPMLRTVPNDTHASLAYEIGAKDQAQFMINGKMKVTNGLQQIFIK